MSKMPSSKSSTDNSDGEKPTVRSPLRWQVGPESRFAPSLKRKRQNARVLWWLVVIGIAVPLVAFPFVAIFTQSPGPIPILAEKPPAPVLPIEKDRKPLEKNETKVKPVIPPPKDRGWDVREILSERFAENRIWHVGFSQNGDLFFATHDKHLTLWQNPEKPQKIKTIHTTGMIRCAAMVPGNSQIVIGLSSSNTNNLWLHDVQTGKALKKLPSPGLPIDQLAVSCDGRWLAFLVRGGRPQDGKWPFYVVDLHNPLKLRSLFGHQGRAISIAFDEEPNNLLSLGTDKKIAVWDLKDETSKEYSIGPAQEPARIIARHGMVLLRHEKELQLWNWRTNKFKVLSFLNGFVHSVEYDGNRKLGFVGLGLSKASTIGETVIQNGNWVCIVDFEKRKILNLLGGHRSMIRAMAVSPDGRFLLTGSMFDGRLQLSGIVQKKSTAGSHKK